MDCSFPRGLARRLVYIGLVVFLAGCARVPSDAEVQKLQQTAQEKIGATGEFLTQDFDPLAFLTTWNFNNLPPEEREKYYKEKPLPDGTMLREYRFFIEEKEIEVAPGVFYPAWTYNGQVPGPTVRATEGDTIRITFDNRGGKPHTMHFHGFHAAGMDGSAPDHLVHPGESFTYEFKAEPYGTHIYHCHSYPVSHHITRGLYGAYIVDPKVDTRPKADRELVMVMNGFDVNFDGSNEIYAVNSRAFAYAYDPIPIRAGERVRIHLSNMLEFDLVNSFHVHATFFDHYDTGTRMTPDLFTDTVVMGQGERAILDVTFKDPGMYMFHAHVTEFAELGWMGMFHVIDDRNTHE